MANNVPDVRPPSKGERLTVRFDEGEVARVRRRSLAMGVAPSAFVRAATLDAVAGELVPTSIAAAIDHSSGSSVDTDELRRLRTEMNRVGVNFNQTVRKVNAAGVAAVGNEEAVERMVELGEVLKSVEELLGGMRRA